MRTIFRLVREATAVGERAQRGWSEPRYEYEMTNRLAEYNSAAVSACRAREAQQEPAEVSERRRLGARRVPKALERQGIGVRLAIKPGHAEIEVDTMAEASREVEEAQGPRRVDVCFHRWWLWA